MSRGNTRSARFAPSCGSTHRRWRPSYRNRVVGLLPLSCSRWARNSSTSCPTVKLPDRESRTDGPSDSTSATKSARALAASAWVPLKVWNDLTRRPRSSMPETTASSHPPGPLSRFEPEPREPRRAGVDDACAEGAPGAGTASNLRCSNRTQAGSSGHARTRTPSASGPFANSHARRCAVTWRPSTLRRPVPRSALRAPSQTWWSPVRSTCISNRSAGDLAILDHHLRGHGSRQAVGGWTAERAPITDGKMSRPDPWVPASRSYCTRQAGDRRWAEGCIEGCIARCIAARYRVTLPDAPSSPRSNDAGSLTGNGFGEWATRDSNPEPAD